ncbi:hypothetical protein B0H11DRAFT_2253230 [Mycena galericulata]|nr:hypothetical protein B0H11DRAFT_2253230 [Mycena galericulata]
MPRQSRVTPRQCRVNAASMRGSRVKISSPDLGFPAIILGATRTPSRRPSPGLSSSLDITVETGGAGVVAHARRISTPCVRVLLSTRSLSRAVLYCGKGGHKSGISLLLYLGTHLTLIASRSRTPDAATQAPSSPRPAVPSGGKTTSGACLLELTPPRRTFFSELRNQSL